MVILNATREWEKFKSKISKKLNKAEEDLVMSKASEYREQMEEYDVISRAKPEVEKHGSYEHHLLYCKLV